MVVVEMVLEVTVVELTLLLTGVVVSDDEHVDNTDRKIFISNHQYSQNTL